MAMLSRSVYASTEQIDRRRTLVSKPRTFRAICIIRIAVFRTESDKSVILGRDYLINRMRSNASGMSGSMRAGFLASV